MAISPSEGRRLRDDPGPYLSERAWGTVREDYSGDGEAWNSFPHDHARSRVYRWNEDCLGGICDDQMTSSGCASRSPSGTGRDPILKERIFGVTGPEANRGEDAKEYWWYLDSTPSHSWMRWRYRATAVSCSRGHGPVVMTLPPMPARTEQSPAAA